MHTDMIGEQIKDFINTQFRRTSASSLSYDDNILDKGIVDSLGILDVVNYLENEFAIIVLDDDLVPENFQTINRISALVRHKLDSKD